MSLVSVSVGSEDQNVGGRVTLWVMKPPGFDKEGFVNVKAVQH